MPRKTKIIFITVFAVVGISVLSIYLYINKNSTQSQTTSQTSGYKPFLGGSTTNNTSASGNSGDSTSNEQVSGTAIDQTTNTPQPSRFHQITTFSVAGATFFEDTRPLPSEEVALTGGEVPLTTTATTGVQKKDTKVKTKTPPKPPAPKFEIIPSLRYVERVTGHIDQMYLDNKSTGEVSNSTIPSIYEAYFDGKASSVIYRYLGDDNQTITSFLATLGSDSGEFLPSNILDISISPDKTKFFYLTKSAQGVVGTIRSFKDTKKNQIFNSSLTELLSQWVTNQSIYLTTKAAASVEGDIFNLNTTTGVLTRVFGGVKGLTTLANNDGSLILYSVSTSNGPKLGIFDVKNHTSKDLNIYGLPEKCVWGTINIYCSIPNDISGNQYPDVWYQGLVSFDDHFVKINILGNQINVIANSTDQVPLDGTHLFLNKTENQLFFINKKDSTLWSLDL